MPEERKIKLIWDFRGGDAIKTAEHHAIHLEQYKEKHKLGIATGAETLNEYYAIAYITVIESEMITVRDALKPHRGELAE